MEKVKIKSKKHLLTILVVIMVIAMTVFGALQSIQPPKVNYEPQAHEFSVENALKHVEAIAQKPHPMGSEENKRVRDYIVDELVELGLNPQIQSTIAVQDDFMVAGKVENIVARLKGTNSTHTILILAHYDSVITSPGASDDGAAVATMLESLRVLKNENELKNDIIFLFTDGEEVGLIGAQAFVDKHPWAKEVDLVLNLEARGTSGPSFMYETSSNNLLLVRHFIKAAPYPVANSLMYEIYKMMPNGSDLTVFKKAGYTGLNFAYIHEGKHYHTQLDNISNLDIKSLNHHGLNVLPLLKYYGNLDLSQLKSEDNAIYFNILGKEIISYPQVWAIPLAISLLILFIIMIVYGIKRKILSAKGILMGVLSLGVAMLVVPIILQVIWEIFGILNVEITWITEFTYFNAKVLIAYFLFATTIVLFVYRIFRRSTASIDLFVGTAIWWAILGLVTSILIPGASYLLIWPWALGLTMLGIYISYSNRTFIHSNKYLVGLVPLLMGILIVFPMICLVPVAMGSSIIGFAMILYVLLLSLIIPFLDLRLKTEVLNHGILILLGIGLMVQTIAVAGFTENNPKANHLMFVQNLDKNEAYWVSADSEIDEWTGQFISSKAEKSAMTEAFPFNEHQFIIEREETVDLPRPKLSIINESSTNDTRTLILNIKSSKEDSIVRVFFDTEGDGIKEIEIDDKNLPVKKETFLEFLAVPKEGIDFKIVLSKNRLNMIVVEQSIGFPKEFDGQYSKRPDHIIPEGFDTNDSTFSSMKVTY